MSLKKHVRSSITFFSGVATIAFMVLTILWFKNAEVHGSRLLDVAQVIAGKYGMAGLSFLFYLGGTILPIPLGPVHVFALTLPVNPAFTTAIVLFAGLLGSLTNFYLARLLGHGWVARQTGHTSIKKSVRWFDKNGPMLLLIFGILPLPVFDVLTLFAGLSDIGVRRFLLYSLIGRSISAVAIALITLKLLVI